LDERGKGLDLLKSEEKRIKPRCTGTWVKEGELGTSPYGKKKEKERCHDREKGDHKGKKGGWGTKGGRSDPGNVRENEKHSEQPRKCQLAIDEMTWIKRRTGINDQGSKGHREGKS